MFPPSASAVGTDELLRQLRDPAKRREFHDFREPIHKLGLMGEWDRLALFEAPASPELVGKDFATIGRERGQHPLDAMMDILLEAGDDAPNVLFVGLVQTQEDLDLTFASATCVPESDATTLAPDGPLAAQRFLGAYTWAAFYLRCIVRERAVVTLEEGIRRLTSMPARRVGLTGRGELVPGRLGGRHGVRPGGDRGSRHGRGTERLPGRRPRRVRQRPRCDARWRLRRRGGRQGPAPLGARGGGMIYLKGVQR